MNNEELHKLRRKLIEERQEIETRLVGGDHYGLTSSMRDSIGEFSMYDNHPADIGTELYERGKDVALNDKDKRRLAEIENAIQRIDIGTYGICEVCGQPIPYKRLEANPTAKYCKEHQPVAHISNRRSVEEDVLSPPFEKYNFDQDNTETQFDAEDAWQAVERYGTSNPADFFRESEDYNHLGNEPEERHGVVEDIEGIAATTISGERNEDGSIEVVDNDSYNQLMIEGDIEDEK